MGKTLEWLGLSVLAGVIVAGGGLAGLMLAGGDLDKDGQAYANETIQAVTPGWSVDALQSRLAPEISQAPPNQIADLFDKVRGLGSPVSEGCRGQSNMMLRLGQPLRVSALYNCKLDVPNGPEYVTLALERDPQGLWQVAGLRVNSPLLTLAARAG